MSHISVNPKHQKNLLFVILDLLFKRSVLICLLFGAWNLVLTLAPPARAGSDPLSATPSATATVPSFNVSGDTDAPSIPILLRPTDGIVTGDPRPELVWHESTDVGSNTVIYTLYLDSVATYLGISNLGNSAGAGYTSRLEDGDLRLLPSSNLSDGTYSWYVVASDLSNNSARSATWHFTVDTTPPPLTLLDLDTYHLPDLANGPNFELAGPKDVYFTLSSDPFVTVQLTLTPCDQGSELQAVCSVAQDSSEPLRLSALTSPTGLATLYTHLDPDTYTVTILAIDQGGNTTLLPDFTLTITQAQITVPLPPLTGLPPSYSIPYTPYTLPSLTASISNLQSTTYSLPILLATLLALVIILLLIILERHRFNLILLDSVLRPLGPATIYHSLPYTPGVKGSHLPAQAGTPGVLSILHTPHSKLYIPHLSRYSTLTIRTEDKTTILSISANRRLYTIIL